MKIIIDIDKDLYEMCRNTFGDEYIIEHIVANGTPLEEIDEAEAYNRGFEQAK